jgi:hypothetical protein
MASPPIAVLVDDADLNLLQRLMAAAANELDAHVIEIEIARAQRTPADAAQQRVKTSC